MTAAAKVGAGRSDQRDVRVKRALSNPVFFGEAYFAIYDPNWTELLPPFAHDMMRFMVAAKPWPHVGGVIMLPPEFLKTTLGQVYALWRTVRARVTNTLLRGMLFSEQEDMAKGNLAVLKWHIEHNERLAEDFADGRGKALLVPDPAMDTWRDDSIIVHRPNIVSRDPTWQAKGLDSAGIQGRRLDLFIADDMVTPRNASSPAKRKSALDTMELTIEPRVVAGGQILLLGNFNDAKDLLSTKATEPRYRLFKRPTLHKPDNPSESPAESALTNPELAIETWPQNWSRERALVEYRAKPNRFRRIHLLDPRAEHGDRLQTGWVQLINTEQAAALLRYARLFMSIDPTGGEGESDDLDYCAITVLALTQGHADAVQSFAIRAPLPRQVEMLGRVYDAFRSVGEGVVAIGVSKIALDRFLAQAVKQARPDVHRKLHEISIPTAEQAKEVRIEALGPQAHAGYLRVLDTVWRQRTSDAIDQVQELTLEEEWREFPYGNHDDRLDGLDIALRCADDHSMLRPVDFKLTVAER